MHVRLALQIRVQGVAATRIVELVDHVEDLLLLVVRERRIFGGHRVQGQHQAIRAHGSPILPRPGAAWRETSGSESCTNLISVSVHLGSAFCDRIVATNWRTAGLASPAMLASLSKLTSCTMRSGSNAVPPPRRCTFDSKPARYRTMMSSNARDSPSTTNAQAICGFAPGPAFFSAAISASLAGSPNGRPYSARASAAMPWIGSEGTLSDAIAKFTPSGSLAHASCLSASAR